MTTLSVGAMSFYDLKAATKDIDVVVKREEDATLLIDALESSGYKKIEKIEPVYLRMKTPMDLDGIFL